MNRRSLLRGSVLAGVAGALAIKAPKAETAIETVPRAPTLEEYQDIRDEIMIEQIKQHPWYQDLLQRQVLEQMSGYQVMQEAFPMWYRVPQDQVIITRYDPYGPALESMIARRMEG